MVASTSPAMKSVFYSSRHNSFCFYSSSPCFPSVIHDKQDQESEPATIAITWIVNEASPSIHGGTHSKVVTRASATSTNHGSTCLENFDRVR
jgi:hypothetical protein